MILYAYVYVLCVCIVNHGYGYYMAIQQLFIALWITNTFQDSQSNMCDRLSHLQGEFDVWPRVNSQTAGHQGHWWWLVATTYQIYQLIYIFHYNRSYVSLQKENMMFTNQPK